MNISKDNLDCIKNLPGVNITSCIMPCTENDKYATHDSFYGKGGWREVDTLRDRDAIPVERRRVGMAVHVAENDKIYILRGSVNNYCWREWNALDDVINGAIADGTITVDVSNCVTQRQFDLAIEPYIKETEVDSKLEDLEEDIKKWVEDKEYLTEHQPLDDYATMEWVEQQEYLTEHQSLDDYATLDTLNEAIEDVSTEIIDLQAQITENDEDIEELRTAIDNNSIEIEGVKATIVEIQEALGGGEEQSFATKEEVEELSNNVTKEIDNVCRMVLEVTSPLISRNEVEATYAKTDDVKLELDKLSAVQNTYLKSEDLNELLNGKGYITKAYLRGYATEFFVKDYVAQAMLGKIKPGQDPIDLSGYAKSKDLDALTARITELENKIRELEENK